LSAELTLAASLPVSHSNPNVQLAVFKYFHVQRPSTLLKLLAAEKDLEGACLGSEGGDYADGVIGQLIQQIVLRVVRQGGKSCTCAKAIGLAAQALDIQQVQSGTRLSEAEKPDVSL
jgi:hypothetical protein